MATRVLVAAALLIAALAVAGAAAADRAGNDGDDKALKPAGPPYALKVTLEKCSGFTTAAGDKVPKEKMFVACNRKGENDPRFAVGGGGKAEYTFKEVPDQVHCSTYTAAAGDRTGPFAKWHVLARELRSGVISAYFQDPAERKRGGRCDVRVHVGDDDMSAVLKQKRLYARIVEVLDLGKHTVKAKTTRPFLEAKYAGTTAGLKPLQPGFEFDLGPVSKAPAAAFFDLLDGPLRPLYFTATELRPAALAGKDVTYALKSAGGKEVGAQVKVHWHLATEGEKMRAARENKATAPPSRSALSGRMRR